MKFNIEREHLLPALQTVNTVIERRQSLPILSNLLFSINKDRMKLIGTDLEIELIVTIDQAFPDNTEITLSARKLRFLLPLAASHMRISENE